MTDHTTRARLAYDDANTPATMTEDCRAVSRNLDGRLEAATRAATRPAPSILFDDYPREVSKRDIRIDQAAQRIANAMHLHLD